MFKEGQSNDIPAKMIVSGSLARDCTIPKPIPRLAPETKGQRIGHTPRKEDHALR
jgi:hypothetical protein